MKMSHVGDQKEEVTVPGVHTLRSFSSDFRQVERSDRISRHKVPTLTPNYAIREVRLM